MKRAIIIGIEILFCYVLQTSLHPYIALANIMPNLLLVLTVAYANMHGRMTGLFTGLFCGLIIDLSFGSVIGLYAGIYMVIGYFNGYARKIYAHDDYVLPLLFIGVSDIVYGIAYYIFEFLLRGKLNLFYYFRRIILPEAIYTIIAGILLYKLFQWLDVLSISRKKLEAS